METSSSLRLNNHSQNPDHLLDIWAHIVEEIQTTLTGMLRIESKLQARHIRLAKIQCFDLVSSHSH